MSDTWLNFRFLIWHLTWKYANRLPRIHANWYWFQWRTLIYCVALYEFDLQGLRTYRRIRRE